MKIYEYVKIDIDTGEILEEKSFEYDGPIAKCDIGGPGGPGGPGGTPDMSFASSNIPGTLSPTFGGAATSGGAGTNASAAMLSPTGFLSSNIPGESQNNPLGGIMPGQSIASPQGSASPMEALNNALAFSSLIDSVKSALAFALNNPQMAMTSIAPITTPVAFMSQFAQGDPNIGKGVSSPEGSAGVGGAPGNLPILQPFTSVPQVVGQTIFNNSDKEAKNAPMLSYFNRFTGAPLTYDELMKLIYSLG